LEEDSFEKIRQLHDKLGDTDHLEGVPFAGGCLGYFAYEANHQEHGITPPVRPLAPLASIGLYNWALIQNHAAQSAQLIFHSTCPESLRQEIIGLLNHPKKQQAGFELEQHFMPSMSKPDYVRDVDQIKELILAGDCYQVNYAQHFSAPYTGDAFTAYLKLKELSPTPLAAYMDHDWGAILSLSPERFVSLSGQSISTFPIKGTMPRSKSRLKDDANKETLRASQKDRSENLMIVDLMRNDLSRVSEPGSVKTPTLFELKSFPTVHHLISEITATLGTDKTALDLLHNCLPGGSISGAPKRRALEIIDSLERVQRSIYCGSIFYWSSCGNMDSSIAIRTMLAAGNKLHCWGGGGITADSIPENEWQETLDKVQPLMERLQSS
jgi:para-aminobenzoate synthetase component 1